MWVVPYGLVLSFVESLAFVGARHRRHGAGRHGAATSFRAWLWNLAHLGPIRVARRRAQALRTVHDRDLRELQVGPSARARSFVTHHHGDQRLQTLGERVREIFASISEVVQHPASLIVASFAVAFLFGSRSLLSDGVPAVGSNVVWPGIRALADAFGDTWRYTGMGSTAAPPPVLAMMAGLGTISFGSVALAQTLVVVGSFALGALGAYRLARVVNASYAVAVVTAVVYGASPVPRNAIAHGRLGPLVLYGLLPFIVALVLRVGRFTGLAGAVRRPLLGLTIVTAIAGAWFPPALVVAVGVAAVLVVIAPLTGEIGAGLRALGFGIVTTALGAVLLFPWSGGLIDAVDDPAAFGVGLPARLDLIHVLTFQSGPSGAGIASWGLLAAAATALLVASGPRLAWAIRGWALAIAGYALVYLPGRLAPDATTAAPEAGLSLAALGLAVAAGIAIEALSSTVAGKLPNSDEASSAGEVRTPPWRRAGAVIAAAGVVVLSFGFLGDVGDGRWRAPDQDWSETLTFTKDQLFQGEFRVLWMGDPAVLPLEPAELSSSLSYVLTRNGPGDARELLRAPDGDADRALRRAVLAALDGRTSRFGRVLATFGIRYVAITSRVAPGAVRHSLPAGTLGAFAGQLDLTRLGTQSGLVLYQNDSWVPARSVVGNDSVPVDPSRPLEAATATNLRDVAPLGDQVAPAGTVLLSEAYDDGWQADASGAELRHRRAFGVTNQFAVPRRSTVNVSHTGQLERYGVIAIQIALWIVAIVWWGRGRRRARRLDRTSRVQSEEQYQTRSREFLALALDDDDWLQP